MNNTFPESTLCAEVGSTAAQRRFLLGRLVHAFVKVSGVAVLADTTTLSYVGTSGETSLYCWLHNHGLQCSVESHQVVISAPEVHDHCKSLS